MSDVYNSPTKCPNKGTEKKINEKNAKFIKYRKLQSLEIIKKLFPYEIATNLSTVTSYMYHFYDNSYRSELSIEV